MEMIISFPEFLPEESDRIFDCIDENHMNQIEKIIFLRIAFFRGIESKKFDQFIVEENSHSTNELEKGFKDIHLLLGRL